MLVDEHIVLDLDDKFNMVLAMPWIARHDPVIDWTKRTIVHFGSSSAMALAVHATLQQRKRDVRLSPVTPRGHQRLKESLGENSDAVVSTISVDTQVQQEEPVTDKDSDLDATAQGADAIGTNVERRSAGIRRRCKEGASALGPTLQAVRTVANVPHRKCLHARVQPGCTTKRHAIKQGLIACARGLNPPAIKRKICPRPGLEKIRSAEPGSAHVANGASGNSLKSRSFDEVLREYRDVLPDDIPAEFSQDKGVQHEIDIVPGTKYCVTRQWPLRREQVKAIDDFFERRPKAGQVRESKSPHSAPTFRVKKAPADRNYPVHDKELLAMNLIRNTSHLLPVTRRDSRLERGDTLLHASDVRTQVHLDVRSGLPSLTDLGLQELHLLPYLGELSRLEVHTTSKRSQTSAGDGPWRLPAAPVAGRTGGELTGLSSESLIIGSGPKVQFMFEFVGYDTLLTTIRGIAGRPDERPSGNGDGVRIAPPAAPPKGVKLEQEL
ncbi:hypothetical protein PR003_g13514 [Phytophthora rubi]|uniref:Reverse transcriptase n=1 Tax=Phytophthora rubi TaxID=129364 RepID=A0A6A4EX67_9STRA|nr:hypothetical protein PR003_g13514 [Phytophthora rubi]